MLINALGGNGKCHCLYFVGNYLQMMNVLRTIGFDVLECLSQLYDYYLYAVSCYDMHVLYS